MTDSKSKRTVGIMKGDIGKYGIHGTVVSILKRANRSMSSREITDRVLDIRKIDSETPLNSVSWVLQRSKHIRRVGHGLYRYRN